MKPWNNKTVEHWKAVEAGPKIQLKKGIYQDGSYFFNEAGTFSVMCPFKVPDFNIPAAEKAREWFAKNHPTKVTQGAANERF